MNYSHTIAEIKGIFKLKFERISKNKFKVSYGEQIKEFDSSDKAATEFSKCLLHMAECEGKLDGEKELFEL
jgi:hypothetical protein